MVMIVPSEWRANELAGQREGGRNRRRVRGGGFPECRPLTEITSKILKPRNVLHSGGRGRIHRGASPTMRDDYLQAALKVIDDPNILVNVISRRVKQLKRGNRALVESLEKLSPEDTALREVMEGKISYELATKETLVHGGR